MKTLQTVLLVLVMILLLGVIFCPAQAQTTSLSFTQVTGDLNRPGAGANEWSYDQNIVNIPTQGTNTQRLDRYWRFTWLDFQPTNGSAGVYDFTTFDAKIQQSITKGQTFSFGVMQQCGGCDPNLQGNVGGNKMLYPLWLHNQMQAESPQDFTSGGEWFPNYNSPSYLTALKNLNVAINAHILAGSFNGVPYKNVIGQIDIRGYGDFGEWTNNVFTVGNITVATGDSIISYHVHVFNTFRCLEMIAANDGGQLGNTNVPPLVGFYGLNASNAAGRVGLRRDSWGQTDSYLDQWMGSNPTVVSGYHFDTAINNRFKYAPVAGEPQDGSSAGNFPSLASQMTQYGVTSFGNGNFNNGVNATIQNNFRAASQAAGYAITIDNGGSMTTTPAAGSVFNVTLPFKNLNGIPPYISWKIVYEWWNGTTLLQRDTSAFDLKGFLSTTDVPFSSNILLRTVPAGTGYSLHIKVVDPLNYRIPMPLFITGRLADGSYAIRGGITVTSNSGGAVADAGPNQNISITSVNLTSAASQGATSQTWTRISGPNSPTITTPTAVTTSVTGLITGTYVFQVCINGGPCSGQLISQVTIVVNAPPVSANAGSNQIITLPTSSVLLTGAGSTGATTYSWTNISGPNTPTIVSPTGTTTAVTGLIAGTYIFQLSINAGASTSQVQVTVLPAPAPVANAGPSQAITLPLASVTLNGSGSSGTISSYTWSQDSGPNTASISTPSTVNTIVSGLIQGVYIFRLTLNGGSSDTAQVVVSPAIVPPPAPSGVNIFTTQTPNAGTLNDGPQGGITGIEIGVKFRTTVGGFITGVRFYKKQDTTTRQIGFLYNSSGTILAQANFTYQGNNGWQTVQFVPAVVILPNTTYIVAIFSPSGNYVSTNNYFTGAISNLPVIGLGDGTDGHNGIYKYTASPAFPNAFYQSSNYWVDPYFTANNPGTVPGHFSGGNIYFQAR